MAVVIPWLLYHNVANDDGATVTYASEDADFPIVNGHDWFDWTLFHVADGASSMTIEVGADTTVDACAFWIAEGSVTDIEVETEDGAGVYTTQATLNPTTTRPVLARWSDVVVPAGSNVRITFTGASDLYLRQWSVGAELLGERGQRGGLHPPTLNQGATYSNVISVNGSIIGRTVRKRDRRTTLALEHLSESWVRNQWEAFTLHCDDGGAFWYAWDYLNYPDEVTMAACESHDAPVNMDAYQTMMSVSMDLRNLI